MLFEIPKQKIGNVHKIERTIPYIIHQTFKTNIVPKGMYDSASSYINKNNHYDYFFYDDDDILRILETFDCTEFSFSHNDLLLVYNGMKIGAGKADIFRYLIMYTHGGCYFDIDTVCVNPLDTFICDDDEIVSGLGSRKDLHQWGMIYRKHHPFMKKALENCISNIINKEFVKGFENRLEGLSGPPCLDVSIKQVLNLPIDYEFTEGVYTINSYRFHILNGDYFGNNIVFKYASYTKDLETMGMKHWTLS